MCNDGILRASFKFGTGSYSFIQQHIRETDPRAILRDLLPDTVLPPDLDDMTLWQIIINISEPPKRKKRKDVNTLEDVVKLLKESKRILVLTGAGVCCTVWMTLCSTEDAICLTFDDSFICRCLFLVASRTFALEMEFMHALLWISLIFQTPKLCLTLNTLDGTRDRSSSLPRSVGL